MLFSAAVSASMQQLLAVMHGPGATGILPPEKAVWSFLFLSLDQFLVFPKVILFLIQDLVQPWQRRLPPKLLSLLLS